MERNCLWRSIPGHPWLHERKSSSRPRRRLSGRFRRISAPGKSGNLISASRKSMANLCPAQSSGGRQAALRSLPRFRESSPNNASLGPVRLWGHEPGTSGFQVAERRHVGDNRRVDGRLAHFHSETPDAWFPGQVPRCLAEDSQEQGRRQGRKRLDRIRQLLVELVARVPNSNLPPGTGSAGQRLASSRADASGQSSKS